VPFWLRILLFGVGVLVVEGLTSYYVYRRGSTVLGLGKRGRIGLAALLFSAPVAIILARTLESALGAGVAFGLGAFGMTIVLGVLISTVLMGVIDLPVWIARRLGRRKSASPPPPDPLPRSAGEGDAAGVGDAIPEISRREMIHRTAAGAAMTFGFGASIYGAVFGRHDYEVTEVPVRIPGLSPHLDGYRIAQLSDIHFGIYVGDRELESAVSLVRSARPDLVVLTGDLVDHDPAYAPQLGRLIRRIEQLGPRDGVVVIPGNHDYYAGIDEVLGVSRRAGARVLRNQARAIGDRGGAFALVGVDDVWSVRNGYGTGPDLDRAVRMVSPDLPRVLLCHNPEFFPEAQGKVALQMSGHTHGGQVALGFNPAEVVLPYVRGLYDEGGSKLYVNRGSRPRGTTGARAPPASDRLPSRGALRPGGVRLGR
jgi:predicted MPP superfamily phosphohydrolase